MNKPHLVTIKVTQTYEIMVNAPDDNHIFEYRNNIFNRHINSLDLDKLTNPENWSTPINRTCTIEEVIEPKAVGAIYG